MVTGGRDFMNLWHLDKDYWGKVAELIFWKAAVVDLQLEKLTMEWTRVALVALVLLVTLGSSRAKGKTNKIHYYSTHHCLWSDLWHPDVLSHQTFFSSHFGYFTHFTVFYRYISVLFETALKTKNINLFTTFSASLQSAVPNMKKGIQFHFYSYF